MSIDYESYENSEENTGKVTEKRPGTITFHNGGNVIRFDHIAFPKSYRNIRMSQSFKDSWRPTGIRKVVYTYPKKKMDSDFISIFLSILVGTIILVLAYLVAVSR